MQWHTMTITHAILWWFWDVWDEMENWTNDDASEGWTDYELTTTTLRFVFFPILEVINRYQHSEEAF